MTASPTAPAAMPSEEEIRALFVEAVNHALAAARSPLRLGVSGTGAEYFIRSLAARCASALEEKERLVAYWLYQHDQGQEEIRQLSDNLTFAEHECENLEARALAAEAALAAERERCAKVAERTGTRTIGPIIAAAIRAQE